MPSSKYSGRRHAPPTPKVCQPPITRPISQPPEPPPWPPPALHAYAKWALYGQSGEILTQIPLTPESQFPNWTYAIYGPPANYTLYIYDNSSPRLEPRSIVYPTPAGWIYPSTYQIFQLTKPNFTLTIKDWDYISPYLAKVQLTISTQPFA